MANAVSTDAVGNHLVGIVPFGLYEKCIQNNARALEKLSKCQGNYNIVEVPKLLSNEPRAGLTLLL
jgi:hypothetical protein